MSVRLKAIYKDGAFVPIQNGEQLNVRENTEVEITVHDPYVLPPTTANDEERERALRELFASQRDNCRNVAHIMVFGEPVSVKPQTLGVLRQTQRIAERLRRRRTLIDGRQVQNRKWNVRNFLHWVN